MSGMYWTPEVHAGNHCSWPVGILGWLLAIHLFWWSPIKSSFSFIALFADCSGRVPFSEVFLLCSYYKAQKKKKRQAFSFCEVTHLRKQPPLQWIASAVWRTGIPQLGNEALSDNCQLHCLTFSGTKRCHAAMFVFASAYRIAPLSSEVLKSNQDLLILHPRGGSNASLQS